MKSYKLLILVFILLMGIFYFNEVQASELMNLNQEEILNIKRGMDSTKIDYNLRHEGNEDKILSRTGIESFAIDEEGRLYLSNFATGKIKVYYNNSLEKEIDISQFTQPRDIMFNLDSVYILEDSGKISQLLMNSESEFSKSTDYGIPLFLASEVEENGNKMIPLEEEIEKVRPVRFLKDYFNEELFIIYDNNSLFHFKDAKLKSLDLDKYELPYLEGVVYKQIIGIDKNSYIYITGIEISKLEDTIDLKELVYRFDSSGHLTGIAEPVDESNYLVPYKYLDLNGKGELYQLLVLEDRVKVFRLSFQNPTDFKRKGKEKNDSSNLDSLSTETDEEADTFLQFREVLYNRAVEILEYSWTYKPGYQRNLPFDVELPFYLKKLEQEEELTGIPYCWGGFDSLESSSLNQNWLNFLDALEKKAIIGNVGITVNYHPGTSGLDCSGFVSAVLGLESRRPSWYFYYKNDLVEKISYEKLSLMDILVKNGHSFFYLNKNDYGINSIETNILGSEWKVKYYSWSWRALRDTPYRARGYKELAKIPAIINQ